MSEDPTPFEHPADPVFHDYDYTIRADHTRLTGTVRAHLMSIAMDSLFGMLAVPGVDEQAVSIHISKRGASHLPDWEIVGPDLAAAFGDLLVIAEPHLSHADLTRFTGVLAKAGGRA